MARADDGDIVLSGEKFSHGFLFFRRFAADSLWGCPCRGGGKFELSFKLLLWVPAPTGGVLFPRRKSTQKCAKTIRSWNPFISIDCGGEEVRVPPNDRFLRGPDLKNQLIQLRLSPC